jgi:pSer/pThr/pTyr-binding forkhead associated (FHA) protein
VIGRMSECDITIPDTNVSRRHAEIRSSGTGFVGGRPRLHQRHARQRRTARVRTEKRLADGDIISVGATHLRFEAS